MSGHAARPLLEENTSRELIMRIRAVGLVLGLALMIMAVLAQAAGATGATVTGTHAAGSDARPVRPGPKPDLTYAGAEEWTKYWSEVEWGDGSTVFECYNTGENVKGKTQWYCYGEMLYKCLEWQVNVGPYGERTYIADLGCPSVVKSSSQASSGATS